MRYAHFELFNFEILGLYKKGEGQTLSQRLPFFRIMKIANYKLLCVLGCINATTIKRSLFITYSPCVYNDDV